ncbi:hypothetical protein, conserved [Leishmania tarentolae]|uniref:Peptidase S9 prolyl oligopeptidase catalytic domain-containing protein n=1 Tax=Leishmania tarentolae TaxID=5689 RepID=A0A640KVJ5_LEITA|nr:hypothetical protein, conserved [Leishmania tarentolae]
MLAEEAVLDDACEASSEEVCLLNDVAAAPPQKGSESRAKWVGGVTLVGVFFLLVTLYLCKNFYTVLVPQEHPISVIPPLRDESDSVELIRELNDNGSKIHLSSLLPRVDDGCALDVPALPKGKQTVVTFRTDESTEREAVVYVPKSYPTAVNATAPKQVALMLLFHGLNDNCKDFLVNTRFIPYAERDGFVIASVCGSQGFLGTGWNAGMCCGFLGDKPNDVALAKQVVAELSQVLCIDKTRVMAVGFSNGAMLSEVLACEAPETFRVVASVGGVVEMRPGNDAALTACTAAVQNASSTMRSSVLMVHGTADLMVPWNGSDLLGFPSVLKNLEGWRERNQCTEETNTTISTDVYVNTIYAHCSVTKHAVSLPTSDHESVETATRAQGDASGIFDAMENTTGDVPSAVEDVAVCGGERHGSRIHAKDHRIRRESRWNKAQLKRKHRFCHACSDKRDHTNPEHAKVHEKQDNRKARHREDHRWINHEADRVHPHSDLQRQERLSPDGHHKHVHVKHRRQYHRSHAAVPTEDCEVQAHPDTLSHVQDGTSQVELVRVIGGHHRWPHDKNFSTTDYIYDFGIRIFGRYN